MATIPRHPALACERPLIVTETREPTRLMLVVETGEGALARLEAALAAGDVASVVIRAAAGRALDAASVKPLVAAIQARGVAALIDGDARLARTLKADGVHVPVSDSGSAAYAEAREIVGSGAIVGFDAGRSRHDAMTAGEEGADYVAFGIPAFVKDRASAEERQIDLVAWWTEIFEVPAVAFDVADMALVGALADAGADFVAVSLSPGAPPSAAAELVRAAMAALGTTTPSNVQGEP